ncbi:putative T7SS-secreted protein [Kitasatospora sp. NPDC049285]|uniref:putative T7SS-secreted protein n=1 Tax=Kitasatospora sp. NPDC049285 TaxID=3157096 RepID=UPI003428874C
MSGRADFPALGFDPAPGNPENVDGLVAKLNRAAGAMESAHRTLVAVGRGGSIWEGDAAKGFAGKVGELPTYLSDSVDAMKTASTQLGNWRTQLTSYQDVARRYEQQAADAKRRKEAAQDQWGQAANRYQSASENPAFALAGKSFGDDASLADAQRRINVAAAELRTAESELDTARRDLESIQDELEAIVKQARELLEHHHDDADRTAKALRRANQNAPEIGMWEKIGNGFKGIGNKIKDWATRNAGLLKKIGDIAGGVSAVLGIAALATMWCPPLSAALGVASAGASAVALGSHGLAKLGGADVSWSTIALDGVGVVPFVGAVGKAGKGAVMGVKAIAKGEGAIAAGSKLAEAGRSIVNTHMAGGLLHSKVLTPVFTKTPLKNLPGIASIGEAGQKVFSLPATSWWSRGTQIGMKTGGLIWNAPNLYHQVTGS